MEILFDFLLRFCLIYPGAFLRWIFKRFNGSYLELTKSEDSELNSFLGALVLVLVGVLIILIL